MDKKKPALMDWQKKNLAASYFPVLLRTVSSAMKGLTSEVGMGSGMTPSLKPPRKKMWIDELQLVFIYCDQFSSKERKVIKSIDLLVLVS